MPGSPATWAGVAAGAGAAVLLPLPWGLAVAVVVGWSVRRRVAGAESRAERRHRLEVERELPLLVDLVGSLLVAGTAPEHALARVRAVLGEASAEELRPWVERLRLGDDPSRVWAELAEHPLLGRLGRSLHRAGVTGSPVAEALLRLGDDLRSTARAETDERVRRVEVRATAPLALCLLPSFVLLGVVPLVAGTVGRLALG